MRNKVLWKAFCLIVSLVLVLAGWHITALILATPALPTPTEALSVCLQYASDLAPDFGTSFQRVGISLLLGTVLGAPVGLAFGRCKKLDQLLAPAP